MKCLYEVGVELRSHWFLVIFIAKVLLPEFLDCHGFVLEDLADGSGYFRMYL